MSESVSLFDTFNSEEKCFNGVGKNNISNFSSNRLTERVISLGKLVQREHSLQLLSFCYKVAIASHIGESCCDIVMSVAGDIEGVHIDNWLWRQIINMPTWDIVSL